MAMEERMLKHGRDKEPESDDPMELMMSCVPGDPAMMARCVIEEYTLLGASEEELLNLFRQPGYHLHRLYLERGEDWVRELIRDVLEKTGRLRVSIKHFYHIGGCDG
jgi:hypothetical protein